MTNQRHEIIHFFTRLGKGKRLAIFATGFALIATMIIMLSRAATPATSTEAETGTLSNLVSPVSDATASNGSAVRFANVNPGPATMTLTINAGTKYQTMDGFGVNINSDSWNNGELKPALDMLIDQNGSRLFRVVMEMADWEGTNDDANASNYNWAYYNPIYSGTTTFDTAQSGSNFANLWNTIDYLHQKGIPDSQIILSFMGPGPSWMGGKTLSSGKEEEWAEMVTSAAYYGYSNGHTFGIFSPNNEQDISANEGITMSGMQYASGMNKVATRMDALGMTQVRLLGPETATPNIYWGEMTTFPNLMSKIDHFDFHSYTGDTNGLDADIKASFPDGSKNFWMSEFAKFDDSFALLNQGASAILMWDAYDAIYNHAIVNGLGRQPGNDQGNAPPIIAYSTTTKLYTPRKDYYYFTQLYKYVLPGMQRVNATSSNGNLRFLAFVHPSTGAVTIVGQNNTASAQVIGGTLTNAPSISTLHFTYTDSGSHNISAGSNVPVNSGSFTASVPGDCVFTLTTL